MDSNHLNEHLWKNIKEPAERRLMRLLVKYADPRTGIVSADDVKKVERKFSSSGEEMDDASRD
ncbi:MAG: hypothetical protein ACLQOO_09495 [Terriglobia bacterium]